MPKKAPPIRAALERCLVPEPAAPVASDPLPAPEPPPLEETEQGRQMLDRQRKAAEQGGTVNVRQPARPEPEQKSKPKRRPLWVIALAAVLVVALALVFSLKSNDPFEAWPELGEDAALRSFVTIALEDGLTVTGCDTGEDGKVKTIDFADAAGGTGARTAEVGYYKSGHVSTISEYNASGNRTKKTRYNADGSIKFISEYDASGNRTKTTRYNADGSIDGWNTYEYDVFGNWTKTTRYNANGTIADVYEY